jgi:hypothetical protein
MWFNRHRMANQSHTVGDGQWPIAGRSAGNGGARRALSFRVPRPPRSGELVFAAIQIQPNSNQISVNRPKARLSNSYPFVKLAPKTFGVGLRRPSKFASTSFFPRFRLSFRLVRSFSPQRLAS